MNTEINAEMLEALMTISAYPVARSYPDGPCIEWEDMRVIRAIITKVEEAKASAVNSHHEILEALKMVIRDKAPSYHDCADDGEAECAWCIARAAIKNAEEAQPLSSHQAV